MGTRSEVAGAGQGQHCHWLLFFPPSSKLVLGCSQVQQHPVTTRWSSEDRDRPPLVGPSAIFSLKRQIPSLWASGSLETKEVAGLLSPGIQFSCGCNPLILCLFSLAACATPCSNHSYFHISHRKFLWENRTVSEVSRYAAPGFSEPFSLNLHHVIQLPP